MKKRYIGAIIFFTMFFFIPFNASALVGETYNTKIRPCPATNDDLCKGFMKDENYYETVEGTVELLELVPSISPSDDECEGKQWYRITFQDKDAYICASLIERFIDEEENNNQQEEPSDPSLLNTIPTRYDVIAYASHPVEGRVPVVSLKEGLTSNFNCDKKIIVIDNKLNCVSENILSNYATVSVMNTDEIEYDFEEEMKNFPKSYQDKLRVIHEKHPSWRFYAYNTGLDWNSAIDHEKNSSLISIYRNDTMFDTEEGANFDWYNNVFIPHEAGVWVTPSRQAVAYFMDPRTYLNINNVDGVTDYRDIFVFEDARAYTYQVDAAVDKMLYYGGITGGFNTPYGYKTYRESFVDGSSFSKISPLILIARSRNETGNFTSGSVSGNFYNDDNNTSYAGLYNFFNVGAYGMWPITNGLIYARNAGWTDPYKSITEGSIFIGTKYIYYGQETQYFQKFNVSPYTLTTTYGHQYQTNIEAPMTESNFVFWGYYDSGNIDKPIVFHIPVYDNMTEEATQKPVDGNPNSWLKSLNINGVPLEGFNGDKYYSFNNNWDDDEDAIYEHNVYNYVMPWDQDELDITCKTVSEYSKVTGAGKIKIDKSQVIYITVSAYNKTTKTYAININKQEPPEVNDEGEPLYPEIGEVLNQIDIKYNDTYMSGLDLGTSYQTLIDAITNVNNLISVAVEKNPNNKSDYFATGDIITIKTGKTESKFIYLLYGDTNGDGIIDLFDLVGCRNIILGSSNLTGANKEAADTNKDNKIDIIDLVQIRNSILGTKLSQR